MHRVKLTDFGVAIDLRSLESLVDNDQSGDSVFMAPELLKTDLPLTTRITQKCDVFSLGVSLLQLASSLNLPNNGALWQKLREGHQIMFSPSANRSKHLETLVNRMMTPDPQHRPTIEDILMHPCIRRSITCTNAALDQAPTTISKLPAGHRKAVIMISPSTVAQETQ